MLHGIGQFLLQESVPPYERVTDVVVVEAQAGDRFLVPPNYGHLTTNPGSEPLVFEGFLIRNLEGVYEPYKQRSGGAYYEVVDEDGKPAWIRNERYRRLPPLRAIRASEVFEKQGLGAAPCYAAVVAHPDDFQFLTDPTQYRDEWRL